VSWRERYPDRLEYELQDFVDRGLRFAVDESESARTGRLVLRGHIDWRGEDVELIVVYPEFFPFFRPEVFAPGLQRSRHINPVEGNLCLLDRATKAWNTGDTGAWLVDCRVPKLLGLLDGDPETMRAGEAPQGEPASVYLPREVATFVLVPEPALTLPADAQRGYLTVRLAPGEAGSRLGATRWPAIRALLETVQAEGHRGAVLAVADEHLRRRYSGQSVEGRWVRFAEPPVAKSADELAAFAQERWRGAPRISGARMGQCELSVVGVVYPEEVGQGVNELAWTFIVQAGAGSSARHPRRGAPRPERATYLVRGERYSLRDLRDRIPATARLECRTVALAGLGSLGAPLALELARAQLGNLRVLDCDVVEASTTVRWALGLAAVAQPKASLLAGWLPREYPYVSVEAFDARLGEATLREGGDESEQQLLDRFVGGADVVVDATAEFGVGHLLGWLTHERRMPLLLVSATEGGWGGRVVRLLPGVTGCWFCLQTAIMASNALAPPAEPNGTVQPRGCATRTFTGAGFDLTPVVAQAARVLVQTLRQGSDSDRLWPPVHVMALHAGDEALPVPRWTSHPLRPNPECELCAGAGQ
jgi:molybdopterin/thiamine biosynthesis adenylyltransferase